MSTNFSFRFKTKSPSRSDIYRYILRIFTKYQQVFLRGSFHQKATLRHKGWSSPKSVDFEFSGYFENMSKNTLLKNLADCNGQFDFQFGAPVGDRYLFDFRTLDQNQSDNKDFDYTIESPSVKFGPFFDFVDDIDGIFFDEEFVFGTISIDPTLRLEDQFVVCIKQGVTIDQIPTWLHGIFDPDRFTALGDFLGNGVNFYMDKKCQSEFESGHLREYWFFDYFSNLPKYKNKIM
ncbi:hypothetical protein [Bartonella sp. HY038]|uniref:hypothetical protein n=1 Tax=Bartonella sp. HY038 TaxID=2759660 RepID=UPI0015FBD185|nr:hypothetical protein [Bartonella sp. HY038]